jgi:hypothetical protein
MKTVIAPDDFHYVFDQNGTFSFVITDQELLSQVTNRENVCLKIFFKEISENNEDWKKFVWGRAIPLLQGSDIKEEYGYLKDCVYVQNICALFGLAPRVFDVVRFRFKDFYFWAYVTEYLVGLSNNKEEVIKIYEKIDELGKRFGFRVKVRDINADNNAIDDKLVDFQNVVVDWGIARKKISDFHAQKCVWGDVVYQNDEIVNGEALRIGVANRDNEIAFALFNLLPAEKYNVWDIGCSGGHALRTVYQKLKGMVNRAVGFDYPEVVQGTKALCTYYELNDLDFVGLNIKEMEEFFDTYEVSPDIILYLSVQRYFGLPKYLGRAQVVVYEHNGDENYEDVLARFKNELGFGFVREIGQFATTDNRKTVILSKKQL